MTPPKFTKRRAARFFAVQALYQTEHSDQPLSFLIDEFSHFQAEDDHQEIASNQDHALFVQLVEGVIEYKDTIDTTIQSVLSQDWVIDRLDSVVRAIFRVSAYELTHMPETPTAVIVNEYLEIAKAFFGQSEVTFIHVILDKIAKSVRAR